MKLSWRTEWPHWLLLAGLFALALATWSTAPARIPVHWGLTGGPDRYGGRFEGLFALPLTALGLYVLLLLLPRLDPGRANYPGFAGPYGTVRLVLLAVLAAVYVLVHLAIRRVPVDFAVWMPLLLGVLFVVLGNALGKVRPNWFVGIRTPWTLSSKLAWDRTHRAGGWMFVLLGVLSMASAALRAAWATVAVFVAVGVAVAALVVYSYVLWRRDPDKTHPAGTQPAE